MKKTLSAIPLIFIFCFMLCAFSPQEDNLNGSWKPVREEIAGRDLPPASFETQKLVIADSTYTFTAESTDRGIVKYAYGKMDIYGKEGVNAGRHFTAIYKLEDDKLTVCYNLSGAAYPEEYQSKENQPLFLCVFQRQYGK